MAEDALDPTASCQAQPAAVRRGFRDDKLCASSANTNVIFRGREVPVCRMHEVMYSRWAEAAEANASELWAWSDATNGVA